MEKLLNGYTRFCRYALSAYYKRRYIGAIISGEFAKGKTTTAMHMAREIFQAMYDCTEKEAWNMVLDNILFSMDDVIEQTSILETVDWESLTPQEVLKKKFEIRKPCLIWDDAGVHGSSYKHFLSMSDAYELQSNFDTIRDVTSCMIITVPEDEELLRFLRHYRSHYFVDILTTPDLSNNYGRQLVFWRVERDKFRRRVQRKKWTSQPFSIYVPRWVYGEYDRRRTMAKIENTKRYRKRKQIREAKAKYYEMRKKIQMYKWQQEIKDNLTKIKEENQ